MIKPLSSITISQKGGDNMIKSYEKCEICNERPAVIIRNRDGKNMCKKCYSLCEMCGQPHKNIFDIYDFADEKGIMWCTCGNCLNKFKKEHGEEKVREWTLKARKAMIKSKK